MKMQGEDDDDDHDHGGEDGGEDDDDDHSNAKLLSPATKVFDHHPTPHTSHFCTRFIEQTRGVINIL